MTQTATRTVPLEVFQREREKRIAAEQFIAWEDQLFAHQDLIPSVKLTMRELRRHPPEEAADKLSPAPIWRIAKNTGIGDKTTGKNISFLDAHKVLKRDEQHDHETQKTQVSVQLLDTFFHPKKIELPPRPKSGYHPPKPTCPACNSELDIETSVSCPQCGLKHIVSARPATEHDTDLVEKFTQLVRLDKQLSEDEAADNLSGAPTMEAVEEVSDNPITYRMPEEVSAAPDIPNTPPVVVEDPARQAAELLIDIAGEHTEHIKMVPNESKYITVKGSLDLGDMRTHLRGGKTFGARLYHSNGMTRALCFDADGPEDWQRKIDAARLLKIMDFKPILEPSPIPEGYSHAGGGRLWIVFNSLVDAYSALQNCYQYTGDLLQHSEEYWPKENDTGNRVRLPGGKYVHADFKAWCKLYDADWNELSHDGPGAAAVLLAYQTPVDIIDEYPKPEVQTPDPEPQPTKHAPQVGGYLEKDLAKQVIADFNASHSWEDLLGKSNRQGKYCASWRGDRNPNVAVDSKTDLARDFSIQAWVPRAMDKYQVYCFIEGKENWQEFKRRDLAQRCAQLREAQEPDEIEQSPEEIPTTLFAETGQRKPILDEHGCPTRMTICCNVPFQLGPQGPECSNPQCPGKQQRRAS